MPIFPHIPSFLSLSQSQLSPNTLLSPPFPLFPHFSQTLNFPGVAQATLANCLIYLSSTCAGAAA